MFSLLDRDYLFLFNYSNLVPLVCSRSVVSFYSFDNNSPLLLFYLVIVRLLAWSYSDHNWLLPPSLPPYRRHYLYYIIFPHYFFSFLSDQNKSRLVVYRVAV